MADEPKTIRDTDDHAIRTAKTLVRTARFGSLAVIDPTDGSPSVSRVGVATDFDGTPLIFVSSLAKHTQALLADRRCSLLLGEPGKGDALAHPRIGLICRAERIEPATPDEAHIRRRYLNRNPKAALYADLGDFCFFRLGIIGANLNGGFGRAYKLTGQDLSSIVPSGLADSEQGALEHMNADHVEAIQLYASHFAGLDPATWRIAGFDAEGIDLAAAGRVARVLFPTPLVSADELRSTLVSMAKTARLATQRTLPATI